MSPLRIVVAHPGTELYGSDRVLIDTVRGLVNAGHQVEVAVPETGPLVDNLTNAGARVHREPQFVLRKSLLRPRGWLTLVRTLWGGFLRGWRMISRERPDLVWVNTSTLPLWPLLARLRGVPSVLHVHEAESTWSPLLRRAIYSPAAWATRIVANSRFTASTLVDTMPSLARRLDVVLNPVHDPGQSTSPRRRIRGAVRLVIAGRISPRKGTDLAIAALPHLRERGVDATLTVVGDVFAGYEWYTQQLREEALDLGVTAAVEYTGFVRDVGAHLAQADIVLVPSRVDESFGNAAIEAVLAQRPVIVADSGGLREAVEGLPGAHAVPIDDPTALVDTIASIADSWTRAVHNTAEAAKIARERHDPDAYGRHVARIAEAAVVD